MPYDELKDCYEKAPKPTINIEHTLAIIKPDAMNKADEIVDIILKSGFTIINVRCISVAVTWHQLNNPAATLYKNSILFEFVVE